VTSIGYDAFFGCSGFTSVHITDIAKWCCISFHGSYANPLYYAHNLYLNGEKITDLTIPYGITSIYDGVFYGCRGLTNLVIASSVTNIGDSAFCGCSGLTSVTIPEHVTNIGSQAFFGCSVAPKAFVMMSWFPPNGITAHDGTNGTILDFSQDQPFEMSDLQSGNNQTLIEVFNKTSI